MGPGIIIPLVVLALAVPAGIRWATKTFKQTASGDDTDVVAPASRLTSNALRELDSPPWRVVYEIGGDRLGGVEHVVIGPAGIFALETTVDPMPAAPDVADDARHVQAVARVAIVRADVDDALARCAMSTDRVVRVHWGAADDDAPAWYDPFPGFSSVGGRHLRDWVASLPAELTPTQVDLAWRTVTTAIGRPDPLA